MEKTTVYLTSQQKAALARAAEAEGSSEARLIRAGVDAVTAGRRAGEARPALAEGGRDIPQATGRAAPATLDRPRWIDRDAFVRLILREQADPALREELRELAPGTTDDESIP